MNRCLDSIRGIGLAILFTLTASRAGAAVAVSWPGKEWQRSTPAAADMDAGLLAEARDYALTGEGAGIITRHGKIVLDWGDSTQRFDLKSTTKSFGSIALGLAIKDGLVRLEDRARRLHPTLGTPPDANDHDGWLNKITLHHLASQTAGFEKPGGYTRLLFEPGSKWDYSDSGPNWLAECLTLAWRRDVDQVMFERVFTQLGISRQDLVWRGNQYRPAEIEGIVRREFGAGISANVNAMARIGLLMLREGRWKEERILTPEFVRIARSTPPGHEHLDAHNPGNDHGENASHHYGLLWWNNADGALDSVPKDAYWSWGLYDSLIAVIPSLDLVVSRAGKSWRRAPGAAHYDVLRPFLGPIARSVRTPGSNPASVPKSAPPYPPSPIIRGVEWAPAETILRMAKGSDNWPMTWADDDALYTAYGDGNGFEPFVLRKLSMGFARITGNPPDPSGFNIRSPSAETRGDGRAGKKASGLLCVDGVLYLWARNATNSQLAWSHDHGGTWIWANWRFGESFGCPTFLNFGKDYAGARDEFVYIYSPDTDTAYDRADRMILARVPKGRIRDRAAYEFFRGLESGRTALWTADIRQRGAVFSDPGNCYRSHVTYNAGLKRYLWCQTGRGEDTRFAGGFAIYDAPEPWGPWTTVFATDHWDVGPGESSSLPAKWMSSDGRIVHLVFSGDDCFSVRQGKFLVNP